MRLNNVWKQAGALLLCAALLTGCAKTEAAPVQDVPEAQRQESEEPAALKENQRTVVGTVDSIVGNEVTLSLAEVNEAARPQRGGMERRRSFRRRNC